MLGLGSALVERTSMPSLESAARQKETQYRSFPSLVLRSNVIAKRQFGSSRGEKQKGKRTDKVQSDLRRESSTPMQAVRSDRGGSRIEDGRLAAEPGGERMG